MGLRSSRTSDPHTFSLSGVNQEPTGALAGRLLAVPWRLRVPRGDVFTPYRRSIRLVQPDRMVDHRLAMQRRPTPYFRWVPTILLLGCVGEIAETEAPGGASRPVLPSGGTGTSTPPGQPSGAGASTSTSTSPGQPSGAGPSMVPGQPMAGPSAPTAKTSGGRPVVRLLSREELKNTIQDLFGVAVADSELPYADIRLSTLASPASDFMGATDFERMDRLTYGVAQQFVAGLQAGPNRCADKNMACLDTLLSAHGRRIFRRPIDSVELKTYKGLYTQEATRKGHDAGLVLALTGMLQSPHFLYRSELGEPVPGADGLVRLADWEYAAALSFLLTRSTPDDALLDAAGALRNPATVSAQVSRLLASKRGSAGVLDFYERWLGVHEFAEVEKDAKLFPTFDAAFKTAARREFHETVRAEVLGGGSFRNLLLTSKGFVEAKLAAVYGVRAPVPAAQADLGLVRAGLLTQVAFLAAASKENDTNPMHVGKTIFDQVLCQPFPSPPDNALLVPFTPMSGASRRQNMDLRTAGAACQGCHKILNGVAFSFDAYDPIGRHRRKLEGLDIDTSGEFINTRDANGRFANVPEMMRLLAASTQVSECHVMQWLRYSLGRAETDADRPSLARAHEVFAQKGWNVLAMLTELSLSDAFVYRRSTP